MTKANELRIGNLVLFFEDDTVFTIEEIMETGLSVKNETEAEWIDLFQFSGIKLTEVWLMKFGFEYNKRAEVWYFGENPITKDWMITLKWIVGEECPFYRNGHFKVNYVHQLQNLYFALTGTELPLKIEA